MDVSDGERCDDGAALPTATCNADCLVIFCGNGIVEGAEACDDGNVIAGDGCSPDCSSNEQCGNGIVDGIRGEECDDGAANSDSAADACRTDCRMAYCGDGVTDASEICDDGAGNAEAADVACRTDCQPRRCGDGVTDPAAGEICDDGNLVSGDGCSGDCLSEEWCGNGYVDLLAGEQCDDGDLKSRDGCDSRCQAELPSWEETTFPALAQYKHAMVYDEARQELVVYGLSVESYTIANTWTLTAGQWLLRRPAQSPPPRLDHAMTYDSHRGRVVMFGGSYTGVLGDTWEWNGATWTETTPASSPSPRSDAALAYDPVRQRVVLFGGTDDTQALGDTWEYDGTTWVEITPVASPPAQADAGLVWDGASIVLYSTQSTPPTLWDYDGATWTPRVTATDPPGLDWNTRRAFAADPTTGELLLFTIGQSAGLAARTWSYSGGDWHLLTGIDQPPPRVQSTLAFDSHKGAFFLFGGIDNVGPFQDTWSFQSGSWSQEEVPDRPPANIWGAQAFHAGMGHLVVVSEGRGAAVGGETWTFDGTQWRLQDLALNTAENRSAVYDAGRGVVLLFGGYHNPNALNDLLEWDGTSWAQGSNTNPPPGRQNASMAYDSARGVTVLFGGDDDPAITTATMFGDTWEYDGTTWTEISASPSPAQRTMAAMGYDPVRQRVVLFGGIGPSPSFTSYHDTWEYDGSAWTPIQTPSSPPVGSGSSLVYDPNRGRMVLFPAGYGASSSIWEYDGTDWTELSVPNLPPARLLYRVSYDSWRRRFLLFSGDEQRADLWSFSWGSATPLEICSGAVDEDGDGLTDCADPDCLGAAGCP